MAIKNKDRRLALRFSLYIQALGATPILYQGQPLSAYVVELQQQYQKLQQELGPDMVSGARIRGRTAIRESGYANAATLFPIAVPPTAKKRSKVRSPTKSHFSHTPVQTAPRARGAVTNSDRYNCRRKLRHTNFLSALLHARALQDDDIQIYSCRVCDGLHVGHDPSAAVRTRRRLMKQIEAVQGKLKEMGCDRDRLMREERKLHSHLAAISKNQTSSS